MQSPNEITKKREKSRMKHLFISFITIAGFILSSQNLNAQSIESGTWTGTITHPDAKTSEVKYEVKIIGDTLSITMKSKTTGDLPFDQINLDKGKLSFSFITGALINCSLDLQNNGSYSGQCKGTDGTRWLITMIPPEE
jgi:hypothetical protein